MTHGISNTGLGNPYLIEVKKSIFLNQIRKLVTVCEGGVVMAYHSFKRRKCVCNSDVNRGGVEKTGKITGPYMPMVPKLPKCRF